jgi:hypothetical protein
VNAPFCDAAENCDCINFLCVTPADVLGAIIHAEYEHGIAVAQSARNSRRHIGDAWSACNKRDARPGAYSAVRSGSATCAVLVAKGNE